MYEITAELEEPLDDSTLWKYLDFTKFVSLLDRQALHFARTDRLNDPFEGSYPNATLGGSAESLRQLRKLNQIMRESVIVSCWHRSEHESEAMWKLYAEWQRGIAIKTTALGLKTSITSNDIHLLKVNYIDYGQEAMDLQDPLEPYITKRTSFSHEQEVRAISVLTEVVNGELVAPQNDYASGDYYAVDLARLIHEVIVAPMAASWFVELVESVTDKYGVSAPVSKSPLAEAPPWAAPITS